MIKLNNAQISALAQKIEEELTQPYKDHNKAITDSKEYKDFIKNNTDCKLLTDIFERNNIQDEYIYNRVAAIIKSTYFKKSFVDVPYISTTKITNDIILNTIDAKDLEELISAVKSKYAN